MTNNKSTLMNHKYAVITILILLSGVTLFVYAEYPSIGNIDVTDRLDITEKVVVTKRPTTSTP